MANSFFGGDMSMAHFVVMVRDETYRPGMTTEQRATAKAQLKANKEIVRKRGYKSDTYFQFRVTDAKTKTAQKAKADALANKIQSETGVEMKVCEGCFA